MGAEGGPRGSQPRAFRGRLSRSSPRLSQAPPRRLNMAATRGLWGCEDSSLWAAILALHGEVLRARADPQGVLEALDRWYRQELPAAIEGRAEKHVTLDELERLLAWKLPRGRFQPRLQQLVTSSAPEPVLQLSATTFRLLPDVQAAVTELCALRGVGLATASAVLAAGAPKTAAFMSNEAVASVPGLLALQYTVKHYMLYLGRVWKGATALSRGSTSGLWSPHHVETALWTWVVGQKLCPNLLPDLSPGPATSEDTGPTKKRRTQAD